MGRSSIETDKREPLSEGLIKSREKKFPLALGNFIQHRHRAANGEFGAH
jgi:hypothetical protein